MSEGLRPTVAVAVALASAVTHAEEYMGEDSHHFDLAAFRSSLEAPAVREYLSRLRAQGLLPIKRSEQS